MFDAEPLQIGFVRPQSADGVIAFHRRSLANLPASFHAYACRGNGLAPDPHAASTSALIFAPSRFSAIARSYGLCKFSQNAAPGPR